MKGFQYPYTFIILLFLGCSKHKEPSPTRGTITIQGKTYRTTTIGNLTWTSDNYDGEGGRSLFDDSGNDFAFGKLYTHHEAMSVTLPSGWRVPTPNDFISLYNYIGGKQIKLGYTVQGDSAILRLSSTSKWYDNKGNNESGFNALPAGYYLDADTYVDSWELQQSSAIFLTSDPPSAQKITGSFCLWHEYLFFEAGFLPFVRNETDRASLRFVKDE